MASPVALGGIYVPLITPFAADGSVAIDELADLAKGYLAQGVAGLVVLGTTGEPATLSDDEQQRVIKTVANITADSEQQLMVGVGSNDTAAAQRRVEAVSKMDGVAAVMSVVPYYTRPSEAGILAHFEAVATASAVPLVAYNVPYRTGRGLGANALVELSHMDNVAGLKQAVGALDADTLALLAAKADGFSVLCGDDAFIYPLMATGATGAIAASSHLATELFVDLVGAATAADHSRARAVAEQLLPLCQVLFSEPSPAVIKAVLAARGLISSPMLRLPMTSASKAATETAVTVVESIYKS